MSKTLYAVRLHPQFRFWEPRYWLQSDNNIILRRFPEIAGLFPTREQAEHFAATTLPIDANPFAVDWWHVWTADVLSLSLYDPYWWDWPSDRFPGHQSSETLVEKIRVAGLAPPNPTDYGNPLAWQRWWETTTTDWSADRREALRQQLSLPPWRPNPFDTETITIEWYEPNLLHFENKHEILTEEFSALAQDLGVPLPESLTEQTLYFWWEESVAKLTPDARTQLWRLLCPYPWEIVPIPFIGSMPLESSTMVDDLRHFLPVNGED